MESQAVNSPGLISRQMQSRQIFNPSFPDFQSIQLWFKTRIDLFFHLSSLFQLDFHAQYTSDNMLQRNLTGPSSEV